MDGKSRRHLTVLEHLALALCKGGNAGENAGGLEMMSAAGGSCENGPVSRLLFPTLFLSFLLSSSIACLNPS